MENEERESDLAAFRLELQEAAAEAKRGDVVDPDEVLKQIEERKRQRAILAAIDEAEDEIERGEVHDWTDVRDSVLRKFMG